MSAFCLACLDDYQWCVDHGLVEDSTEELESFVAGYVATELRMEALRWRRFPAPNAA